MSVTEPAVLADPSGRSCAEPLPLPNRISRSKLRLVSTSIRISPLSVSSARFVCGASHSRHWATAGCDAATAAPATGWSPIAGGAAQDLPNDLGN